MNKNLQRNRRCAWSRATQAWLVATVFAAMAPASHAQVVLDARTLQFTTEAFANFTAGDETESGARGAAADNARFDGGARVLSRLNSHRLSSVRHPVRVSILAVACRRRSYRTRSPCKSIHWYLSVGRPLSSTIKRKLVIQLTAAAAVITSGMSRLFCQ